MTQTLQALPELYANAEPYAFQILSELCVNCLAEDITHQSQALITEIAAALRGSHVWRGGAKIGG